MKTVIQDLRQFRSLGTLPGRRGIFQVSLEIPGQPLFAPAVENDINKSLRSCGCGTGAVFLAGGLVWLAGARFFSLGFRWGWSWHFFWTALGFLLLLAALGKLVGLAASELRLRGAIRKLERAMQAREPGEAAPVAHPRGWIGGNEKSEGMNG